MSVFVSHISFSLAKCLASSRLQVSNCATQTSSLRRVKITFAQISEVNKVIRILISFS